MSRLRIIPLDETVVFPGMPITLPVDVGSDDRVLLVPRRDDTYAHVAIVAEVSERVRLAGRGLAVSLMPLHRATPGAAGADEDGVLRVDFEARPDHAPATSLTRELEREYRAVVDAPFRVRLEAAGIQLGQPFGVAAHGERAVRVAVHAGGQVRG